MSPTEWRLIEVLVQHAGHLVTREELLASVWGPDAVDKTQYLRVHMASIRQKVEPDRAPPLLRDRAGSRAEVRRPESPVTGCALAEPIG